MVQANEQTSPALEKVPTPPEPKKKKSAKICDMATELELDQNAKQGAPVKEKRVSVASEKRGSVYNGRQSVSGASDTDRRRSVVVDVRAGVRQKMVDVGWYNSDTCLGFRKFLRGKAFANVMMVALFLALFMPDLWVVLQMPTNLELDIILCVVMALFFFEFTGLSATDPSYLFGFFFWMDMVGTVSMIADISFFGLGTDATKPAYLIGSSEAAKENLIVVRAARAAKLGARAGRISRVLKVLRFLPFINSDPGQDKVKMARVISGQLTNVLSTRTACLTIVLVVVLPIFGMFSFPEADHSMRAWAQVLDVQGNDLLHSMKHSVESELHGKSVLKKIRGNDLSLEANGTHSSSTTTFLEDMFEGQLGLIANFYAELNYGPFEVCIGILRDPDDPRSFLCEDLQINSEIQSHKRWSPTFNSPERKASHLLVPSEVTQVVFNMTQPLKFEAGIQMLLIICIIIVMCTFGLILSSSVSKIALQPLERMLDTVRVVAGKIFKYAEELEAGEEEQDEEYDDIEQVSEFDLLEKVVKKLAAMAELTSQKQDAMDQEGMNEEDLGVLQFMRGDNAAKTAEPEKGLSPHGAPHQGGMGVQAAILSLKIDTLGISSQIYNSWDFNVLELTKEQKIAVSRWACVHTYGVTTLVVNFISEEKLGKFMSGAESQYLSNPYHNFSHAVDTMHASTRMMKLTHGDAFLSDIDMFSLTIAGLGHDLGHPGLNNPFLVETGHELALRYNDKSPLESMHCARLFELTSSSETAILENFEKEQYKEIRKNCIESILHTDMVQHFSMVKDCQMLYEMNVEVFEVADWDTPPSQAEIEVMKAAENKKLALNLFLHSADVGNPAHPWHICSSWAYLVLDEFFAQGDQEKILGVPVQMLNDRDKVNKPNSQIGFIEFLVVPLFCAATKLFPVLHELSDNLALNARAWQEMWEEQNCPSEEDAIKVRTRVEKMKEKCDAVRPLSAKAPPKYSSTTTKGWQKIKASKQELKNSTPTNGKASTSLNGNTPAVASPTSATSDAAATNLPKGGAGADGGQSTKLSPSSNNGTQRPSAVD